MANKLGDVPAPHPSRIEHETLSRPATMQELYGFVRQLLPDVSDDKATLDEFLTDVLDTLQLDPIRTKGIRSEIERGGQNFKIHASWPLNDFWSAATVFLRKNGIIDAEDKIEALQRRIK